jgi:hypothetical protein
MYVRKQLSEVCLFFCFVKHDSNTILNIQIYTYKNELIIKNTF